jgi:hypothetical protein
MKKYEIESWALNVIERVETRQPIEDFSVELKSIWPEVQKAARRIAGHANAARGEPILWLVGVDEQKGAVGATNMEMASWWSAVKAQFDGLAPSVTDLNIPVKGVTVVALLFETDRAPFVVKNPEGGTIQFEVPWRENTSIRSATRSDLIKLLSPFQKLPSIEVLSGRLTVDPVIQEAGAEHRLAWDLELKLYITPKTGTRIVIPFHRCEATFEVLGSFARTAFERIRLEPPIGFGPSKGILLRGTSDITLESQSLTIDGTETEVLIDGPGMLHFNAYAKTPVKTEGLKNDANVIVHLSPADAERKIEINMMLGSLPSEPNKMGSWILKN